MLWAYDMIKGDPEPTFEPIPNPPDIPGKTVVGYDWEKKEYRYIDTPAPITPRSRDLSDEEIRILREKHSYRSDGSYIHTPGRRVKSREREIQDYIDDNIDDILENYSR